MKRILISILLNIIFSSQALSNMEKAISHFSEKNVDNEKMTYELYKDNYFFSSSIFAKRVLIEKKEISPLFDKTIEKLLGKTGLETFADLPNEILERHAGKSLTLSFTYGVRQFREGKYESAIKYLSGITKEHRSYPESLAMIASSYAMKKDMVNAKKTYIKCLEMTPTFLQDADHVKLQRYYQIIYETCNIHLARIDYETNNWQESLSSYEKIDKKSYLWPYILMEKAWSNYHLKDFNRSLGLLVTYRSPLLSSYSLPETEVLRALNYFQLCLWDDGLQIVENFFKSYSPNSEKLKNTLNSKKGSHTFFYDISQFEKVELEEIGPYLDQVLARIKKTVKYSLDLTSIKKAEHELEYLNKLPNNMLKYTLMAEIGDTIAYRKRQLNHFIKEKVFSFINEINQYSYEMFNIKLEIISQKRDLLYKNEKLISERARGDFENVNRKVEQHFWDFRGEFWADELGEYSFGLKSNCQKVEENNKT